MVRHDIVVSALRAATRDRDLYRDWRTLLDEATRRLDEARALIEGRFGEALSWYASSEDTASLAVALVLEDEGWGGEVDDSLYRLEGLLLRRQWEQERR